jgi:hypothetical protein
MKLLPETAVGIVIVVLVLNDNFINVPFAKSNVIGDAHSADTPVGPVDASV